MPNCYYQGSEKDTLANQQQESAQIATDAVPGEGTQSEEDREGDHAGSGGAVMPESERLQQTPHSATSNSEGQADILQTDPQQLRDWQQTDSTLQRIRELAASAASPQTDQNFFYKEGLIYRRWRPRAGSDRDVRARTQLVLPQQCRSLALRIAHDVPTAGHLGTNKTKGRILKCFYWPGVFRDVSNYCKTCEVCQKGQGRRCLRQAEMIPMPLIDRPFQRIAMDVIGPLPRTRSGHKYILTICDYATRYPEAIAL